MGAAAAKLRDPRPVLALFEPSPSCTSPENFQNVASEAEEKALQLLYRDDLLKSSLLFHSLVKTVTNCIFLLF